MKLLVADAGPLIFLAKLGRLNLLTETDVRIPAAVMAEISAKEDEACKQIEQAANSFLKVVYLFSRAHFGGLKPCLMTKKPFGLLKVGL